MRCAHDDLVGDGVQQLPDAGHDVVAPRHVPVEEIGQGRQDEENRDGKAHRLSRLQQDQEEHRENSDAQQRDGVGQVEIRRFSARIGNRSKYFFRISMRITARSIGISIYFGTFFQSARNFSIPASVRGCFASWAITQKGIVAMSAPSMAASRTCMG